LRLRNRGEDVILPTSTADPENKTVSVVQALRNTAINFFLSVLFGTGTWIYYGKESGLSFFAGYAVEQSLSVDNLFVFFMLFNYFKVPARYQTRVLSYGIMGAVVMRGIMIWIGVAILHKFRWITLVFAGVLILSAFKMIHEDNDAADDLSENFIMSTSRYFIKSSTDFDGDRFFTKENKTNIATPLFMCLVCVEFSDLVFAIDSIPAAIGVSHDPFIIYSSNIFAILGLRSLYTLVAKAVSELPYLKPAVALVLGFVGGKMVAEYWSYRVPTGVSLFAVVFFLAGGVILSLFSKGTGKRLHVPGARLNKLKEVGADD